MVQSPTLGSNMKLSTAKSTHVRLPLEGSVIPTTPGKTFIVVIIEIIILERVRRSPTWTFASLTSSPSPATSGDSNGRGRSSALSLEGQQAAGVRQVCRPSPSPSRLNLHPLSRPPIPTHPTRWQPSSLTRLPPSLIWSGPSTSFPSQFPPPHSYRRETPSSPSSPY